MAYSAQEKAIAIVPKFTSLLSMFGSSFIIMKVIKKPRGQRNTYHRLLLGMSCCDLLASTCFFLTTWPIPSDEAVYAASGNQATCVAQGFFSQFSLATAMYNASLSFFYVVRIRWQWNVKRIERQLEPALHTFALSIGIGTAIAGVVLNLYNNDSWECCTWMIHTISSKLAVDKKHTHSLPSFLSITRRDRSQAARLSRKLEE